MKHPFPALLVRLGPPAHTFRYTSDNRPPVVMDHVWLCGCGARDCGASCDVIPCAKHVYLDPVAHELASDARLTARSA